MPREPHSENLITCRTEEYGRWQVRRGWETILQVADGLLLSRWLAEGSASVAKQRPGRTVYRVEQGNRTFYVKHQQYGTGIKSLANVFRGSPAAHEWHLSVEAGRRGIPTARPIALGHRYHWGLLCDTYFVTEAIPGAEPLDRFVLERLPTFPPPLRAKLRRRILDRLAHFVATAHQAGLRHNDFHAGNILVAADELEHTSLPALYLIDLAHSQFTKPLDWAAARKSLAVLHAEWFDRTSVAERWRWIRTYLKHRPELEVPPREILFDQLDRDARAHSRRIDRGRDRRVFRTNRDFLVASQAGRRLHAVRELPRDVIDSLLRRPDEWLYQALSHPVKMSHTSLMVQTEFSLGDRTVPIALKRARPRNWWKSLCNRFRPARGLRNWYFGHALLARGIDTARPWAAVELRRPDEGNSWRRWFPSRESYLAVEWIEGAENLHLWAWSLAEQPLEVRHRRAARCATSLGRLLGRMHARAISHRDLKGSNLLIVEEGSEIRTWLIDMDGVRIHRHLSPRRQAADLARLAASIEAHPWITPSIRYRFIRAYVKQFPRGALDERSLWQAVAPRARRHIARKKRRGKPLL